MNCGYVAYDRVLSVDVLNEEEIARGRKLRQRRPSHGGEQL